MYFCNAPIFYSAPICRSVLMHYKKMSILSGVIHNKVLHFLVLCRHISKKSLQHKSYANFRWEIVFNNFLNLLEILEFLGDTELSISRQIE